MANVPETLLRNRLFIALLTVFALGAAGCISQQPEMLKVNPVIDYNPLEGFYGKSEGMFTMLKGGIPEVKESLKDIVIKKAPQMTTFSVDDELNFVVFRGVFSSGGYGIDINRVERQGNAFTVYGTYIDPGEGILATAAFTQPVAIIPLGKLAAGDYEARLKVTRVKADADGTKIIRKVIEPEKELSAFNFKVKTPEGGDSSEIPSIPNIIIGVDSFNPPAACVSPTDSFAIEVLLNKAGIGYDLTDIKTSKNVTLHEGAVIYRSHYNSDVAVVLAEVNTEYQKGRDKYKNRNHDAEDADYREQSR